MHVCGCGAGRQRYSRPRSHPSPKQPQRRCLPPATTAQLQAGSGEVFGAELQLGQRVNISGHKLAVYTWEGCKLLIEGEPSVM